jgi:hypothetical protein
MVSMGPPASSHSAQSPGTGLPARPAAYRLAEIRDALVYLAIPACDGEILIRVAGGPEGVQVTRVHRHREFHGGVDASVVLDAAYSAQLAAVLDLVARALDDLAGEKARWRAPDSWTAKIWVPVDAGRPRARIRIEDPVPHQAPRPRAAGDLLPERVARLRRKGYAVPDPAAVASILQQHASILEGPLRSAPAALALFFPQAALELVAEEGHLLLLVYPACSQAVALARLAAFDTVWGDVVGPAATDGLLLIDVEGVDPVPEDERTASDQ